MSWSCLCAFCKSCLTYEVAFVQQQDVCGSNLVNRNCEAGERKIEIHRIDHRDRAVVSHQGFQFTDLVE